MLAVNEVLQKGRYRVTDRFEQNGTSALYEAYDNVLKTNVLLKETPVNLKRAAALNQKDSFKNDFAGEAKFLSQINHESLLHIHDYFSGNDRQYLVMESVDGNLLSELFERNKSAFELSDVTAWADELLDALEYLHARTPPIIHREIKPQNIKLTSGGKIKLLALDIAKNSDAKAKTTSAHQTFDPESLPYLPLEQMWDGLDPASQKVITNSFDEKSENILIQPLDARTDIYALGATLYHLLTAWLPIDALERSIDILEGKFDPLPTPHKLNPNVPIEVSDVLIKAMEIKRENRFGSAMTMRQALRTAVVATKQREAETAKKEYEEASRIQSAEQERLEQARQAAEQERLQAEAEQKRQTELITRQLREAEAQRLKAEQRAANAERRLLEKEAEKPRNKKPLTLDVDEILELDNKKPAMATKKPAQDSVQIQPPPVIQPELIKQNAAPESAPSEFKDLFAASQEDSKGKWRMPVVALILLMLAGGISGFWFLRTAKTEEPRSTAADQTISPTEKAKPETPVQTAPAPIVETTPETSPTQTISAPQGFTETPASRPSIKNKPVQSAPPPAPRAERAVVPPTKPAANQKKPVTVDDIINDN